MTPLEQQGLLLNTHLTDLWACYHKLRMFCTMKHLEAAMKEAGYELVEKLKAEDTCT